MDNLYLPVWIAPMSRKSSFSRSRLIFGIHIGLICLMVVQAFIPLMGPAPVFASEGEAPRARALEPARPAGLPLFFTPQAPDTSALAPQQEAALEVSIISSPWATLDSNNPSGVGEEVPKVFVVEAVITNTSPTTTAYGVQVNLNYNEDPANNWILLPGEDPDRTLDELAPGETYHAYWFARYSLSIGASHRYTVTAWADNADPVATGDNYYGNPEPGKTVKTRSTTSTGNSGVTQVSAEVVVGVAFTVTVGYDLGTDPLQAIFSPVGNTDFDPSAYRLLASEVYFYNDAGTQGEIVADRLYFDTLPDYAENAEVTFTFIALTLGDTELCSYTAISYQSSDKYDQFFCSDKKGTIIPITGTISVSLTKQVSSGTVQQGQLLTYTIDLTNTGSMTVTSAWLWDDVDPALGSVLTDTLDPPGDPDETAITRTAWHLGDVPPGYTGTFAFTILVDGGGQDLADGSLIVNDAFFGINPGSLPAKAALTDTVTTTVQAPTVSLNKTDGQESAQPGQALTYTLRITNSNSASIAADGLVITDELPSDWVIAGTPDPPTTTQAGRSLAWDNLGPIPPGGTVVITIPVTLDYYTPNGTVLANTMSARYENAARSHVYAVKTVTDTTTVDSPVLTITKRGPEAALVGGLITYTIYYTNSGPVAATNVLITDVVPVSTTYLACDPSSLCGESDGVVSWNIGTLPPGSGVLTFSVEVSDTLQTDMQILNDDYGLVADQTAFIPGPPVVTTVNRRAAIIHGWAFQDDDGDGVYDAGESGLPGVAMSLPSAVTPGTTTDANGYYSFRVEYERPIAVSAGSLAGYFRTTPGTVFTTTRLGVTETINFGYAPFTAGFGVVYGTVFEDENYDGDQDRGENGLSDVTITSVEAMTSPLTSDNFGRYTLRYNVSGTVTVSETNPPYYVSTTPDVVATQVMTGGTSNRSSQVDFGDFAGIKITGQVFSDTNVNARKDGNEPNLGLAGARVSAGSKRVTTTLASNGVYTFYLSVSGSPILIRETDPTGYVSTNAIPGSGVSKVDANTLRIVSPSAGTVYTGDFADVLISSVAIITGTVWNDNNPTNGLPDAGEPGLAGAVVGLSSGMSLTTGADGLFVLYASLDSLEVTVTETNPPKYVSTNAIPGYWTRKYDNDTLIWAISGPSGGPYSTGSYFGDAPITTTAIITGLVFDDVNENSLFDGGEVGLEGITVTMEISGANTLVETTDSDGLYQFAVGLGTEVRIESKGPHDTSHYPILEDVYPTTPEWVFLSLPSSRVYPNNKFPDNNFGYSDDADTAAIYGIVFNDLNSDGVQDFGEPGLAGAVIRLDGWDPITTTGNGVVTGTFAFTVPTAGLYTIQETNPSGFRSTTPDSLVISVTLGNDYFVEFGDTDNPNIGTIYGIVFDDLNGNGVQEGEPGIPGVVISVTVGGGTGVVTATTKDYGQYNYGFEIEEQGWHTVSEEDPVWYRGNLYRSTTPDEVTLEVLLGNSYDVSFGDTKVANEFNSIIGIVFNDKNGDGIQSADEPGIEGVTITLSSGVTTTTDDNGAYTFAVTETEIFIQVIETDLPGYHSTTPNAVTVYIGAAWGQVYLVHFGDSNKDTVSSFFGTVFVDRNVNGLWDADEPGLGLEGVTTTVTMDPCPPLPSCSYATNEWGQYTFLIEYTGTYTAAETDPDGYVSTNAIPGDPAVSKVDNTTLQVTVIIATFGNDLGDNLFGDVLASNVVTISGQVWNDLDGDGQLSGEPGLAGAGVSLSSGTALTTLGGGFFTLYAPPGEAITVTETNPSGYLSTNAIAVTGTQKLDNDTLRVFALSAGSTSANNLFGDTLPAISINDVTVTEGNPPDSVDAVFAVTLQAASALTVSVDYATSDGTATTADNDYIAASGKLTFTPGVTTRYITVTVLGDTQPEPRETFSVNLANPVNARVSGADSDSQGLGTINNDDTLVAFSAGEYYVDEGDSGTRDALITVTLSHASVLPVSVNYATQDGTATTADNDYAAASGPLTFAPGERVLTFTVTINGDVTDEADETIILDLSDPNNAVIGANDPAVLTIRDDDGEPGVFFSAASYTVGEAAGSRAIAVRLTNPSGETVTVNYATSDGTAVAGSDYVATSGTLTFTSGVVLQSFLVTISDDDSDEITETVHLALANPVSAHLSPPDEAVLTIVDDDDPPTVAFSASDYFVNEEDGAALITVRLSAVSSLTATVDYATSDGTATAGSDYTTASGTLTFTPGITNQTFSVPIREDGLREPDETVNLTLSSSDNAVITGANPATLTISDNDLPPAVAFSAADYFVDEDPVATIITVTLRAVSGLTATVDYAASDGTAKHDRDYIDVSGKLTFPPGETVATFLVPIIEDGLPEDDETVILELSNPSETAITGTNPVTLTIRDDDGESGVYFSAASYNVGEADGSKLIAVRLTKQSGLTITVDYATSDGTAVAGSDYVATSGTLTFTPGVVEQSFPVTISDDDLDEITETVHLALTNTVNARLSSPRLAVLTIVDDDYMPTATIHGVVFEDANGNGQQDAGEGGIEGVTITLDGGASTATTDSTGGYAFTITEAGPHTVVETDPDGFFSTTPNTVTLNVALGEDYRVDFGDASTDSPFAIILGTVFEDSNGNGVQDTGEEGIPGVTVTLDGSRTATTGPYGGYAFTVTEPGPHTVVETDPDDYFSTTPNRITLDVELGNGYQVDFGDAHVTSDFAVAYGTVFEDSDGNGRRNNGEVGLPGIRVELNGHARFTGRYGQYTIRLDVTGTYTVVQATHLPGYFSTTPDEVTLVAEWLGRSYQVDFGDAPPGSEFGVIYGTVFEDSDISGLPKGPGEVGIPGVMVACPGAVTPTATTNDYGQYTFRVNRPSIYTVAEADPPGYLSSTPNDVTLLAELDESYQVDFGDYKESGAPGSAVVYGLVWEDLNGNQVQDPVEVGLEGVMVTVTSDDPPTVLTTTTDSNGNYAIADVLSGTVTVHEIVPLGYITTTPETVVLAAVAGSAHQVDFGNRPDFATIYGVVFADVNGNGRQDIGEVGIPDVMITLDGGITATTNASGLYTFTRVVAGVHTVVETDPPGYFSTTPNRIRLNVAWSESYPVNFGDAPLGTGVGVIYGIAFEDSNGNGMQDEGEIGIPNVTITLDGPDTVATGPYGSYALPTTEEGPHTVVETDPPGYFSTTPNTVTVGVELGNGYQVDFGDAWASTATFAAIYGTVFEDSDGDGVQDIGEVGIPTVTVTLDGSTTKTTSLYGGYTFTTAVTGTHTVVETDPEGYFSTTPNKITLDVDLGNGYQVDFGDAPITSAFAVIYGTVFEDKDGSGMQDVDEVGIPGVTVMLDGSTTKTSGDYGQYTFRLNDPGDYTVVETDPEGYFSTTPDEVLVQNVVLGNDYEVNFGDMAIVPGSGAVFGVVFEDSDRNGQPGVDEVGLVGVTVALDTGAEDTTNIYGYYAFPAAAAGSYVVTESDPPGYTSTTPNAVPVDVRVGEASRVDFGDVLGPIPCAPDSYEEDDSPGEAGSLAFGVAFSQTHNFCDDSTDWITFTATAESVYTITTRAWATRTDTILTLYDTDGATPLATNDDYESVTDFSSRFVWKAPADGTYYVLATNHGGVTGNDTGYDVWLEERGVTYLYLPVIARNYGTGGVITTSVDSPVSALGIITHTLPDAYEPDDTWEEAKPITDVMQTRTFDSPPDSYVPDKDFASFSVPPRSLVTFTASYVGTPGIGPALELYGPKGAPYLEEGQPVKADFQLVWTVPDGQSYYVLISDVDAAVPVTYTLQMEVETRGGILFLPVVLRNYTDS